MNYSCLLLYCRLTRDGDLLHLTRGPKQLFLSCVQRGKENNEEEGEVQEEEGEGEKEIRTQMQSFAAMQYTLLMRLSYQVLHFLVNKLEKEEEEIDEELAVSCFSRM